MQGRVRLRRRPLIPVGRIVTASPGLVVQGSTEVRRHGVLRSSLPASNSKQRQIYAVWGMCHNTQIWYGTPKSRQRPSTAFRRRWARRVVGASGATGCTVSTSPRARECRGVRGMVMRRLRALLATGVLMALVALALSACGGGASGAGSSGGGEHNQQAKARPLPEGKKPLPPGDEYHTEAFKPSFSFHVVGKGWRTPS